MAIDSSSEDGADIFWPGYVDAVTNLVLNLLFMLTIMIVAVFMFALELSRYKDPPAPEPPLPAAQPAPDPQEQILALQKEVEALQQQVLQKNALTTPQKVVNAATQQPLPQRGLADVAPAGGGLVVNFARDAVLLSAAEADTLKTALAPLGSSARVRVEVQVPTGFSEARRIGFYRVMAVRNQLIAAGMAPERIEVRIRDGAASADNARVLVAPLERK